MTLATAVVQRPKAAQRADTKGVDLTTIAADLAPGDRRPRGLTMTLEGLRSTMAPMLEERVHP